ncbi:MAG: NF038122 family metalloprotease [Phormidesmis sp.]
MSNFNFTFQSGVSSEQIRGFEVAGRIWSQYLDEDAVFNVNVAATNALPSSVVGGALPAYVSTDIATVQDALNQDATSADDFVAIANLNTTSAANGETQYRALVDGRQYSSSELTITQANAKALGLEALTPPNSVDGYVLFNALDDSRYEWNYDFSGTSESSDQQLDFLGMALHELGHIMGFVSGIDSMDAPTVQSSQSSTPSFSLLGLGSRLFGFGDRGNNATTNQQLDLSATSVFDLFRYSEQSTDVRAQELTRGEEAYFSIDGGQTRIAPLSTGIVDGSDEADNYQASHWGFEAPTTTRRGLGFPSLFDFIANPFQSLFGLADAVLSLPGTLLSGQFTTVVQNSSQARSSLGVMDPALVPGKLSRVSTLDLQALDVIGYDLSDSVFSPLDYSTLLQDQQIQNQLASSSQTIIIDSDTINNDGTSDVETFVEPQSVTSGSPEDFEGLNNVDDDLLERRRSRVRTRRAVFFQEVETSDSREASTLSVSDQYFSLLTGNDGQNLLQGTEGDDNFESKGGNDSIEAGAGNDLIFPTDELSRGAGETDYVALGTGLDIVVLGDENGSYYSANGWADSVYIDDFTAGEDKLVLAGHAEQYRVLSDANGSWILLGNDGSTAVAYLNGVTNIDLSGNSLIYTDVTETGVMDPISPIASTVNSSASDAFATPSPSEASPPETEVAGNNVLRGTIGDDALVGTAGSDQLLGIGGIDYLEGGAGADQFVLADINGSFYIQAGWNDSVYIEDFEAGIDQLVLSGSEANYTIQSDGQGTFLYEGDDYIAYLKGVTNIDLSEAQYVS